MVDLHCTSRHLVTTFLRSINQVWNKGLIIKDVWSTFNTHKLFKLQDKRERSQIKVELWSLQVSFITRKVVKSYYFFFLILLGHRRRKKKKPCMVNRLINWLKYWLIDWFTHRKPWGCYEGEYKDCWNLYTSFPNFYRQGMYKLTLNNN